MKNIKELPPAGEVSAAKEVVGSFLTLMKNYDLYPADHSFTRGFLKSVHTRIDNFLSRYGNMKIVIEQKRLLYKSVPIYEAQTQEDNLTFILYRDGLLWLEFIVGLTVEEVKTFFEILNKYKVLHDEPEDDIVTVLWDRNLAHIRYEAKELFFEDVPLLDFSMLNSKTDEDSPEPDGVESADRHRPEEPENILESLGGDDHQQWWGLSSEEFELLRESVREAEKNVQNGDLPQVLFFVLNKQNRPEDFAAVLDFLKDEWRSEIERGDFVKVTQQLINLRKLAKSPPQNRDWIKVQLALFFADISDGDFVSSFEPALAGLKEGESGRVKLLVNCLTLLEPIALLTLGVLAPQVKDKGVRDGLYSAMVKLGARDLSPLKGLLESEDENVCLTAARILSTLKTPEAEQILGKAVHHSAVKVRRHALREHLENGNPKIDEVFSVIDDPDATIRLIILSFLSRERNEKTERMLINYLQRDQHSTDEEHIHSCYMALGRCGSSYSLPFLKRTLFDTGWKSMLAGSGNVRQLGAVKALSKLRVEGAIDILKEGAASYIPAIRKPCRAALAERSRGI